MTKFPPPESYCTHISRPLNQTTKLQRKDIIEKAKYNLFQIPSKHVTYDLLTDSGTGAMSQKQLGHMLLGDESYAGSESFEKLKNRVFQLTGLKHLIPTHQGRAAENVLCSALVKEGDYIPGNTHFDTTKAHIEFRKAHAIDLTIEEASRPKHYHPFKGNIDIEKLHDFLQKNKRERIPFVLVTLTCNSGGGQPVSLENLSEVKQTCKKYGIPLFLDIARFAENAYFIKQREEKFASWDILSICNETFKDIDGATMSCKKDAISPMGGFLALKDDQLCQKCSTYSILFEGYLTYGGMTGGMMEVIAQGLQEVTDFSYLDTRISKVHRFGSFFKESKVPVVEPFGGHAIYIDALEFLPHIPQSQYPAQALGVEAYIEGGIRGVEIGTVLADRDPITRKNRYPKMKLLRLAIPRRTFTDNHLKYIASVFSFLFENKTSLKGLKIVKEAPIMRHFTCLFAQASPKPTPIST